MLRGQLKLFAGHEEDIPKELVKMKGLAFKVFPFFSTSRWELMDVPNFICRIKKNSEHNLYLEITKLINNKEEFLLSDAKIMKDLIKKSFPKKIKVEVLASIICNHLNDVDHGHDFEKEDLLIVFIFDKNMRKIIDHGELFF